MQWPTLQEAVAWHASRDPGAASFLAPDRAPLSYAQLASRIESIAACVRALGLGPGDRLALALPDGLDLAVAIVAAGSTTTCAPLSPSLRRAEYDVLLGSLRAAALVVPEGAPSEAAAAGRALGVPILELVADGAAAGSFSLLGGLGANGALPAAPPAAEGRGPALPGDGFLSLHTSGTTARPRLVTLTHRQVAAAAGSIAGVLELTSGDRALSVMPFFHIHGLSAVFASLVAGGSIVCPGPFSAVDVLDWLDEFQPTWYTAAPAIHRAILERWVSRGGVGRSSLRFVRSASSALPIPLAQDLESALGVPVIEAYGMTEAAPQIASNRLPPVRRKPGSVGTPAGPDIAIVDGDGEPLPAGQAGQIVVRGVNVIERYDDDDEQDGEGRFLRGWLRTGDTGYVDEDGDLFVTGRVKEIINRGGEKISPHEVDAALIGHEAVVDAATFALPHPTLGEVAAAAVVLRAGTSVTTDALSGFLAERLSPFKVPHRIDVVTEIPGSPTGKPRRLALAERLAPSGVSGRPGPRGVRLQPDGPASRGVRLQPDVSESPVEERIAAIVASVLGVERIDPDDHFFLRGGDSLKAAQVAVRLRHELRVDVPAHVLFERPTVAALSRHVSTLARDERTAIRPRPSGGPSPLSLAQRRLWLVDRLDPGNPAYHMQLALHLSGNLDVAALEAALGEICRRHEALRTTFLSADGEARQVVSPVVPVRLPLIDLSRVPSSERHEEALRVAADESRRPFSLTRGPLVRPLLLRIEAGAHVLVVTMHHIVFDAWSADVFVSELRELYGAFAAGRPSPLPDLEIQYSDFSVWQHERFGGEKLESQLAYWTRELRRLPPPLDLPADRPRPAVRSGRGARVDTVIDPALVARLGALARDEGATLFMVTLAGFEALLARHTGRTSFLVGCPVANRPHVLTEPLIGFFANTLALRADLSADPSFRNLLGRVRRSALGAFAHQDVPFDRVVEALGPARDPSRGLLYDVAFAFQNVPADRAGEADRLAPGLTLRRLAIDRGTAKVDLTLYLRETARGLEASWQYDTDLFDQATIAGFARRYSALLEAVAADAGQPVSTLPLGPDPASAATARARGEATPPPRGDTAQEAARAHADGTVPRHVHGLIEDRAARAPLALAIHHAGRSVSYGELNARADALAALLASHGVGRGTLAGVYLSRSDAAITALLGVWKAGGAFVPLDPEYPDDRVAFMLKDAGVEVLLTEEALRDRRPRGGFDVIDIDIDSIAGVRAETKFTSRVPAASDLAYVMYTSGSAGRPKGVMITHGNVAHYVAAMREALGITQADRYLHTASFGFSSSVRQFALPLSTGSAVVVAAAADVREPLDLFALIKRERVTIADLVPSYWRHCLRRLDDLDPGARGRLLENDLRLLLTASEPLPADLPEAWRAVAGSRARIVNMFGQTETTGIVTVHPLAGASETTGHTVPIGRPIPGTTVFVVDGAGRPAPPGVVGELVVRGPGVGQGYLNQPDATLERFTPDGYRTGDLGRARPDGTLEIVGRRDDQVKVRGVRVEPAEIEARLRAHPAVLDAAVVGRADTATGAMRLTAFLVSKTTVPPAVLRSFLSSKLPAAMVPAEFVDVDALPLTPTGKLDRQALPALAPPGRRPGSGDASPPGMNPVESILAAAWADVLQLDRVGPDDNFFDLGGDSLLSLQAIDRAARAGVHVTPAELFQHQTVGELARVARASNAVHPTPAQASPASAAPSRILRATIESVRAFGCEALERAGLDAAAAAAVTEVQIEGSLRGQATHNVVSIPRYARRLMAGQINARPDIRCVEESATTAVVDGDNGPGQLVALEAMRIAIGKAKTAGVGVVCARHSNHFGAAGHYAWLAATERLIGLCTTNSAAWLAATGGVTPLFGTNPLAAAIPSGRFHPILLDASMSVTAKGKVALHLAEGKPLPPGWILDDAGRVSTDPADLAAGLGVPIGGHKGYGLALVMEVLAGVLSGAGFGLDHQRERLRAAGVRPDFGHFFVAIDPARFLPAGDFLRRVDDLIEQVHASRLAAGAAEVLLPGELEMRARHDNMREGVPLTPATYRTLRRHARSAGLSAVLDVGPHR